MTPLTARQQQILDLIRQTILDTGIPPTRAELARALGFRSANAAEDHLRALARKGAIELAPGTSRGIRLKEPMPEVGTRAAHSPLSVPLVGRVAAGHPILAAEHITRQINVDPALFAEKPDYLLTVRGLSMRDAGILEGDLLAVRKSPEARNGQIVVARIGDDVTVKRFRQLHDRIQLVPENPDFKVIEIVGDEQFSLEGVAVGLIRPGGLQ